MFNMKKLGENIVMQEAAKKVRSIDANMVVSALLKEFSEMAQSLAKDLDGDGKSEMQNIQEDCAIIHTKLEDIVERLEKARSQVK